MQELISKYNILQRRIVNVIKENRCRGDDGAIDSLDLLETSEEEFGVELFNFLLELNEEDEKVRD